MKFEVQVHRNPYLQPRLINCTALRALPDLSHLPSLEVLLIESCEQLEALPGLPVSLDRESSTFPDHLLRDQDEKTA